MSFGHRFLKKLVNIAVGATAGAAAVVGVYLVISAVADKPKAQ